MKLLKVNKPMSGTWIQIEHPTKSTYEIICWMDGIIRWVDENNMYAVPKCKDYAYSRIPKGTVCKY